MPQFSCFAEELQPGTREQVDRSSLLPGVFCEYITDSPLDIDTDLPVEPFGSPYDPIVAPLFSREPRPDAHVPLSPGLTSSPCPGTRAYEPTPIRRPVRAPAPTVEPVYQSYLAQQFASPYHPLAEQVGFIQPPPGLGLHTGYEKTLQRQAYDPAQHVTFVRCTPTLRHPTPTRLTPPPIWVQPDLLSEPSSPEAPDINALLEGIYVPTWEELDHVSAQIKELYALRSLIDPQGHALRRTHALSNGPNKEHRIRSGPVFGSGGEDGWRLAEQAEPTFDDVTPTQMPSYAFSSMHGMSATTSPEFRYEPEMEAGSTTGSRSMSGYTLDDGSSAPVRKAESGPTLAGQMQTPLQVLEEMSRIVDEFQARNKTFVFPSRLDFIPLELHPPDRNGVPAVFEDSPDNQAYCEHSAFLLSACETLKHLPNWGSEWMEVARTKALARIMEQIGKMNQVRAAIWQAECHRRERQKQMKAWKALWRVAFSSSETNEWAPRQANNVIVTY